MTNPVLGEAFVDIRPGFVRFESEMLRGVTRGVDRAQANLRPLEPRINTAVFEKGLANIGNIARVVAGAALVISLKRAVDAGEAYAGSVRKISALTGESAEETSRLVFALQRVGINENLASRSLIVFNRNLTAGSKSIKRYFSDLQIGELRQKTFADQLAILAARFQQLEKGQPRTEFLRSIFGFTGVREFGKLLSLTQDQLNALGKEAEEFGLILTEQNVKDFKAFTESSRRVEQATKGLQIQFAKLTTPVLQKLNEFAADTVVRLTNMPGAIKGVTGVLAVATAGAGQYAQTIEAVVNIGGKLVDFVKRRLGVQAAETLASGASTAAARAEVGAHGAATIAVQAHTKAEGELAVAAGAAAAAQGASGAAAKFEQLPLPNINVPKGGQLALDLTDDAAKAAKAAAPVAAAGFGAQFISALGALALPIAVAIGALLIDRLVIEKVRQAAEESGNAWVNGFLAAIPASGLASIIGRIVGGDSLVDAILPPGDEKRELEARVNDLQAVLERAGKGDQLDPAIGVLRKMREEGELSAEAFDAIFSGPGLARIRRAAEDGEDLTVVIHQIAAEADAAAIETDKLGASVGEYAADIGRLRDAQTLQKGQQAELTVALRKTGVETEAGSNVLGNYAQALFEAAEAAAGGAFTEEQAAEARQKAAQSAFEAGEAFIENEKRIAKAAEEGRKRIAEAEENLAETIRDSRQSILDAEENLADAIEDRAKRTQEAQERLASAIKEGRERVQEAEERLKDSQIEGAEAIKDARERLKNFEIDSAKRIEAAEKRLRDARRARVQAITDGRLALEAAIRSGDAEAQNAARLAQARSSDNESVKEAEDDLHEERKNIIKERKDLEEDLADTIEDANERVQEAEEALSDARVEATKRVKDAQEDLAETIEDTNERVQDAARDLAETQRDAQKAIVEAQDAVKEANLQAAEAIDELNGNLEVAINQMKLLKKAAEEVPIIEVGEVQQSGGGTAQVTIELPGNAAGGPVWRNKPSLVGERGTELFIPNQDGQIISNEVLEKFSRALQARSRPANQPFIASSPTVVMGERSTGGEAYIPLGQAARSSSERLLEQIARKFGRRIIPMATGGIINAPDLRKLEQMGQLYTDELGRFWRPEYAVSGTPGSPPRLTGYQQVGVPITKAKFLGPDATKPDGWKPVENAKLDRAWKFLESIAAKAGEAVQSVETKKVQTDRFGRERSDPFYGSDKDTERFMAVPAFPGMLERGNIDLLVRPQVQNQGKISTVLSFSVGLEKGETLLPRVSSDGRILEIPAAIDLYYRTGEHLGVFDTPQSADRYAKVLHKHQQRLVTPVREVDLTRPVKRESGGPLRAGEAAVVGEGGKPELFIPDQNGQVISNAVLRELIQALKNAGKPSKWADITINESRDPTATLAMIQNRVVQGLS